MAFVTITIHFDPTTGKQKEKNGLTIARQGGPTKTFDKGDGVAVGKPDYQNVLWNDAHELQLVTGSDCVVIGGFKFCVP